MRPNEFDDLIRRKFDQNEFEYNPTNWDRLEDQMDRKAKRRKILMWLPLAPIAYISSIAASLAMIITIPVLMQHKPTNDNEVAQLSATAIHSNANTSHIAQSITTINSSSNIVLPKIESRKEEKAMPVIKEEVIQQAVAQVASSNEPVIVNTWNSKVEKDINGQNNINQRFAANNAFAATPEKTRESLRTSISLTGGFHYGTINGYSIGATGKRMLSDKFYVEGEVVFVDNSGTGTVGTVSNQQSSTPAVASAMVTEPGTYAGNSYYAPSNNAPTPSNSFSTASAKMTRMSNARMVSESEPIQQTPASPSIIPTSKQAKYDLYYAQVTPTVGYNVHKNFSIGVGADIQQFLQSDKPLNNTASGATEVITTDKQIPDLDLGTVLKTEVALSKTVRAGVYYRQDMNNIVNPGNKYIDRSYMQLHLKFTIFGK